MASDYQKITSDNIRRRGEEFDDIGEWISEQFYSDRTHFIYELLQNAEDALSRRFRDNSDSKIPRRVQFRLYPNRLEFRHFGKLFTEDDVRAISDILKGTKAIDQNQIGKFGIGFKSVYAFTSTPEVHSGDEHFFIERYIRPKNADQIPKLEDQETLFVFPFNHDRVTPEDSLRSISNKLNNIGVRTLLFLKHINEIEWLVGNDSKGTYLKEVRRRGDSRQVTVVGQNNGTEESEDWLMFERPVHHPGSTESVKVEIAFRVEVDGKTNKEKIVKSKASPLVIFFPTEQETRFGFLVQGPFLPTPSRDNILKDSEWNKLLIREVAQLVSETLPKLKEMGFLNVSLLETLPIRSDDFPADGIFRPIFESSLAVFGKLPLLPTDIGNYITSGNAKLARGADLRKLIRPTQLQTLCNSKQALQWLSGEITENQSPDLWKYLSQELKIEIIDPDSFARKIYLSFLETQDDDWIKEFYGYLLGQESLWRAARNSWDSPGILRNKELLRLNDNKHVKPFKPDGQPYAFLSPTGGLNYPEIKAEVTKNERSLEFLKKLGIREVGERELIESLLKSYYVKGSPDPTPEDHIKHMKRFVTWSQKSVDKALFDGHFLFLGANVQNYYTPDACYIDLPFKDTSLSCLFDSDSENEPNKVGLWQEYNNIDGFQEFAISLGVMDSIKITKRSIYEHPLKVNLQEDWYKGARKTSNQIDIDYFVEGLDDYLDRKNVDVSKLIWNTMRNADPSVLTAKFRPNSTCPIREAPSSLVLSLQKNEWIPNKEGVLCAPDKLSKNLLLNDFVYDDRNGWMSSIQFGTTTQDSASENDQKQQHAQALGIENLESIEIIRAIDKNPALLVKIRSIIESEKNKIIFPIRPSQNPERREEKMAKEIQGVPEKTYQPRERSVRISLPSKQDRETFLRESYTNSDGQMVCQICKNEMPFKKRDGHYYFEAVEVLSDQDIEHEALYLALCPLCAAKYKEFVKRDAELIESLEASIITSEKPEIPICLGQFQTTIKFVETHFLDLKTIIKKDT